MSDERRFFDAELSVETRAVGDKTVPVLVGYAAVFGKRSHDLGGFTEEVAPGAFAKTIRSEDVVALVDHDSGKILGRMSAKTLKLMEDKSGLRMEVDLPDTTAGRDIKASIERGDIKGASFGFRTISDSWQMRDGVAHRTLLEARLRDVGPVTFPAYPDTAVAMRSLDEFKKASAPPVADLSRYRQRQRQSEANCR